MITKSGELVRQLYTIFILITCLIIPNIAIASNRANNMEIIGQSELVRFVLLLDSTPRYSLQLTNWNKLLLTLYDTVKTPLLNKKIGENNAYINMDQDTKSSDLKFHISLSRPVREINSSWLPDKKLFFLKIYLANKGDAQKQPIQRVVKLKNLRFGIREMATRLVMELDQKPLWEMIYREDDIINLKLAATPKYLKRKKYGPVKRLKKVAFKKNDKGVDMGIELELHLDHVRISWMKDMNRFVMDLVDKPIRINDKALLLRADFDEKESGRPIQVKGEDKKIEKEANQTEKDSLPEMGSIVKMKILKKGTVVFDQTETVSLKADSGQTKMAGPEADSGQTKMAGPEVDSGQTNMTSSMADSGQTNMTGSMADSGQTNMTSSMADNGQIKADQSAEHFVHDIKLTVEPELESDFYVRLPAMESVHNLSPEEALFFGRILEVRELNDWEKGIVLIDQFLMKFTDSSLCENVLFLRGDFLFFLLKSGRKEILPKMIESYQEAIRRFEKSKEVPLAYIKMAQANSFMGNAYKAIDYLNLFINKYGEGDYLPLAYITRGETYLKTNETEKAVKDFKVILSRYPQSPFAEKARYGVAYYFHIHGLYEEAEKRLKEIADSNPEFHLECPEFLLLFARNHLYLKNYDMARHYLFKALNIGHQPETTDLLLCRIGDTYHHQSKEKEAETFYRMVVDSYPESEGKSIAKLRLANYTTGVTAFKEIHNKNINKPIAELALLELAKKYYEKKQFSMVMDTLGKMITNVGQNEIHREAKDLFCRAAEKEIEHLFKGSKYKELTDFYLSKRQKLDGNIDPDVMLLVAQSFYNLHQYQDAISFFSQIKPYDLSLTSKGKHILGLAESYIKEGDEKNAETLLEKNRKQNLLTSDQQNMTFLLADIYRKKDHLKKAYDLYQSLVKGKRKLADSDIARAYFYMGEISNRERHYEKAKEALNRCIALAEKDKDSKGILQSAFMELGNSHHKEGRHQQAIKSFQRGFDLGYGPDNKNYWESKFRLSFSYQEVGENLKAENILNEILEEGDPLLQQKVEVKLGVMGLEKQLKRLSIWQEAKE